MKGRKGENKVFIYNHGHHVWHLSNIPKMDHLNKYISRYLIDKNKRLGPIVPMPHLHICRLTW